MDVERRLAQLFHSSCPWCGQTDEFKVRYIEETIVDTYLLDKTLAWGPRINLRGESIFCPACCWEEKLS